MTVNIRPQPIEQERIIDMLRLTDRKEAKAQKISYEKRLTQGYPRSIPEERFLKLAEYENMEEYGIISTNVTGTETFSCLAHTTNIKRAKLSKFLTEIIGNESSEFMHTLSTWATKCTEIENGQQPPSEESGFSESDVAIFQRLEKIYPESYIDSVEIRNINGKAFVVFKSDLCKMTDEIMEVLNKAASDPEFEYPVYVSFSETGELVLD